MWSDLPPIHALVLPQPVYQEFASLRPPLGGRTRLVIIIIIIIIIITQVNSAGHPSLGRRNEYQLRLES